MIYEFFASVPEILRFALDDKEGCKGEAEFLQHLADAVGVTTAFASEELGARPHLTGNLATDVAHLFIL